MQSPLLESARQSSSIIALLNFDATCGGRGGPLIVKTPASSLFHVFNSWPRVWARLLSTLNEGCRSVDQ